MDEHDLQDLAARVDAAIDADDDEAISRFLEQIESAIEKCDTKAAAQLNFFAGNCYAALRSLRTNNEQPVWHDNLLESEIRCLRKAKDAVIPSLKNVARTDLRWRIETNLANALNTAGRPIEAIGIFDRVLSQNPSFAMARANRAHCISWYARYIDDPGHQAIFLDRARSDLRKALEIGVESHAEKQMTEWLEHLDSLATDSGVYFDFENEGFGDTEKERQYRIWCTDNRLFLNPLNDLMSVPGVANDEVSFPSVRADLSEGAGSPPEVYGIFNQLKQEYISARYLLFDSISESESDSLHFSDKRIKLVDMLDYRHYRLWVEKTKMAFLHTYSIFDKIGYLINEHWRLQRNIRSVTFSNVWFSNGSRQNGIDRAFTTPPNWPLRGLYWVSRDLLFSARANHAMDPQAKLLYHIRNQIAHKYLKVHDKYLSAGTHKDEISGEELSITVTSSDLFEHTQKLLALARNSLIYLALGAQFQAATETPSGDDGPTIYMPLLDIPDEYRL